MATCRRTKRKQNKQKTNKQTSKKMTHGSLQTPRKQNKISHVVFVIHKHGHRLAGRKVYICTMKLADTQRKQNKISILYCTSMGIVCQQLISYLFSRLEAWRCLFVQCRRLQLTFWLEECMVGSDSSMWATWAIWGTWRTLGQ